MNVRIFYFIIYTLLINVISFGTMRLDKKLAIKHQRRISERTLFTLALLLGSVGIYAGMYCFRHKTKHMTFVVFIPVIFVLNIICFYYLVPYLL